MSHSRQAYLKYLLLISKSETSIPREITLFKALVSLLYRRVASRGSSCKVDDIFAFSLNLFNVTPQMNALLLCSPSLQYFNNGVNKYQYNYLIVGIEEDPKRCLEYLIHLKTLYTPFDSPKDLIIVTFYIPEYTCILLTLY